MIKGTSIWSLATLLAICVIGVNSRWDFYRSVPPGGFGTYGPAGPPYEFVDDTGVFPESKPTKTYVGIYPGPYGSRKKYPDFLEAFGELGGGSKYGNRYDLIMDGPGYNTYGPRDIRDQKYYRSRPSSYYGPGGRSGYYGGGGSRYYGGGGSRYYGGGVSRYYGGGGSRYYGAARSRYYGVGRSRYYGGGGSRYYGGGRSRYNTRGKNSNVQKTLPATGYRSSYYRDRTHGGK